MTNKFHTVLQRYRIKFISVVSLALFIPSFVYAAEDESSVKKQLAKLSLLTFASVKGNPDIIYNLENQSNSEFMLFVATPVITKDVKEFWKVFSTSDHLLFTGSLKAMIVEWHSKKRDSEGRFLRGPEQVVLLDQLRSLGKRTAPDYKGDCVLIQMWSFGEIVDSGCVPHGTTLQDWVPRVQREHYRDSARRMRRSEYSENVSKVRKLTDSDQSIPVLLRLYAQEMIKKKSTFGFFDGVSASGGEQLVYRFVNDYAKSQELEINDQNYKESAILLSLTAGDLEAGQFLKYRKSFQFNYSSLFESQRMGLLNWLILSRGAEAQSSSEYISLLKTDLIDDLFENRAEIIMVQDEIADFTNQYIPEFSEEELKYRLDSARVFVEGRDTPYTTTRNALLSDLARDVHYRQVHLFSKMIKDFR